MVVIWSTNLISLEIENVNTFWIKFTFKIIVKNIYCFNICC